MCESEFNLIYLSRDNFDILLILIVAVGYNEFEFIHRKIKSNWRVGLYKVNV